MRRALLEFLPAKQERQSLWEGGESGEKLRPEQVRNVPGENADGLEKEGRR